MAQKAEDKAMTSTEAKVPGVTLTIDGRQVTVTKGTTVLEAARQLGIHIPTFCWHPKLKSVGVCRMCYVEIEKMPKLQVSCATAAMDGMVVHTDTDLVRSGRKAVLEFILLNHPLDCPTCDKGGECDLQDLTFAHGVDDSRFDFQKYRFREGTEGSTFDEKRIGPEIILNRNRCILCHRCVRANKEAFGEYDLGLYERGNISEIDAAPGQQVDNPFSGNLVEICPVGALTNSDWRYKIRVWLTQTAPSICNFSSSGTNLLFYQAHHTNRIYRVTSRCNDEIDDGWLSDITRYGYQIANSEERLKTPLIKKEGAQVPASWDEALDVIAKRFSEITDKKGRVCIGGLASPSLDNAALYSFSRLFRIVLNNNNVDFRCDYRMLPASADSSFSRLCQYSFRLDGIDSSDVIVVLGSDLIREHPNEYLRIRKAVNFGGARVFSLNPYAVKSADVAEAELMYAVGTEEVTVHAICLAAIEMGLVDEALGREYLAEVGAGGLAESSRRCGVEPDQLRLVARALASSRKLTLMVGELVCRSKAREVVASSVLNMMRLFGLKDKGQVAALARYANSKGAEALGMLPAPSEATKSRLTDLWQQFPGAEPKTTDAMLVQMHKEEINGFLVLGANPIMLYPDRQFVSEGLEKLDFLVACDLFETETTAVADVVLPLTSWAEYTGEYVNLEGRVQRANAAIQPVGQAKAPAEVIDLIADKLGARLFESDAHRNAEIQKLLDVDTEPGLPDGFLAIKPEAKPANDDYPVPLFLCDDPHHSGHLTEKSPSLVNFAGETYAEISADLARRLGLESGDPVRIKSEVGKIIVPVRVSEVLDNDVVLIPRNFSSTPVTSLLMRKKRLDRVKISKVDEVRS